jgi:DNA-binding NtrC family response regulator
VHHSFKVDVRVISASNLPLADLVATGHFRAELLELLSGTKIVLPPLRERAGDIPSLTRYFLARIGEQPGLRPLGITDGALQLLSAFDWPGNVRQLQAVLFRAAVFCDGNALTSADFPQLVQMLGEMEGAAMPAQDGVGVQLYTADGNLRPLEDIEADVIRLAIGHYRGRMTEVARASGSAARRCTASSGDLGIESAA